MLKVGGGNVSAAEVESYLQRHPAIATVQVVSAPDDYYVEVPAAFVQLKPGPSSPGKRSSTSARARSPPSGVALRPLRHRVAHVRHEAQEGHPARDDRR
jgi:acyl-CoA synthetase (AMP-forming)/AMP-acid ligase II